MGAGNKLAWLGAVLLLFVIVIVGFIAMLQRPELVVRDVSIRDARAGIVVIDVDISNPNIIGATLTGVDGRLYMNGQYVGPIHTETTYFIEARATTSIQVVLTVENVPASGLLGTIRCVGTARFQVGPLPFGVDFDETG